MSGKIARPSFSIASLLAIAVIGGTVLTYQACGDFATMRAQTSFSSEAPELDCQTNSQLLNIQAEKILTTNCQSCHDKSGTNSGLNSFHALFDVNKMLSEGDLVAGDSAASLIYQKISGGTHGAAPPQAGSQATDSNHGLSPSDIQAVANWIDHGLLACSDNGSKGVSGVTVRFATDVAPIIASHNCLGCHSAPSTTNGNVGLKNYSDVIKTVVPNSSTTSILIVALPSMTGSGYARSPLTMAEMTTLTRWILEGANP